MNLLNRLLDENYNVPGESEAMRRGDSNSYLKRMKSRTPQAKMSQAAGRWAYNAVDMIPLDHYFTKWSPPKRMARMATPGRNIAMRHEDREDSLGEITEFLDSVVGVVFSDED